MKAASNRGEVRRAFSETVRKLRGDAGLSQERLALACGIDRAYMSGLERGIHTPTLETIFKLLPELDVSFQTFAREFDAALKREQRSHHK